MSATRLILLPGLDGTGDLFSPFLPLIPASYDPLVIRYPASDPLNYPELLNFLDSQIPTDRPLTLLAESFSGPLAIEYAARHPDRVRGLILVASFILPPKKRGMAALVREQLFRLPFPSLIARRYLVGPAGDVPALKRAIAKVSPDVLALRVKNVLNVDARAALRATTCPILYLAAQNDLLVRPRSLDEIRHLRPDMQTITIDAPHLLLQSHPREAWLAIDPFLRAL